MTRERPMCEPKHIKEDAYEFWARLRTHRDVVLQPDDPEIQLLVAYIDLFIGYLAPVHLEYDTFPAQFVTAQQLRTYVGMAAKAAFANDKAPFAYDDLVVYVLARQMHTSKRPLTYGGTPPHPPAKIHRDSMAHALKRARTLEERAEVYAAERRAINAGLLEMRMATLEGVRSQLALLEAGRNPMALIVKLCTQLEALTHSETFYWHVLRQLRDRERVGLPRLHDWVVTPYHLARARAVVVVTT
jgi:hypothetical protein